MARLEIAGRMPMQTGTLRLTGNISRHGILHFFGGFPATMFPMCGVPPDSSVHCSLHALSQRSPGKLQVGRRFPTQQHLQNITIANKVKPIVPGIYGAESIHLMTDQ